MNIVKNLIVLFILTLSLSASAQHLPATIHDAIKTDDTTELASVINRDNVNECYEYYSVLSQSIRYNAVNCFNFLLRLGADVNKVCNGYVPPIMHAAKYGKLEMIKQLVSKGADINYTYEGPIPDLKGMTPIAYAEKFNQKEIVDYLRSLKNK